MAYAGMKNLLPLLGLLLWLSISICHATRTTKRVKGLGYFVSKDEGFLGPAKHFYIYYAGTQHHFLANSKFYGDTQTCAVKIVHYTCGNDSNCEVRLNKFKFLFIGMVGKFIAGEDVEDAAVGEYYYNMMANGDVILVNDSSYPNKNEEQDDAWDRALKRLGEKKFKLETNNCEHFVTETLTGVGKSRQVNAAHVVVGTGSAGLGAATAGSAIATVKGLAVSSPALWFAVGAVSATGVFAMCYPEMVQDTIGVAEDYIFD